MEENEVQVREGISSDGGDTTLAISKVVFFFFFHPCQNALTPQKYA